jgi:hypothetical protein
VFRARETAAQAQSTLPPPSIGYSFEHTPVLSQEAVARAPRAQGRPLPSTLKGEVEHSTGARLDDVRIHTGPASNEAASALRARAYTIGQDIHFAANQFRPGTPGGDRLILHETIHTLQQGSSAPVARAKLEVSTPADPAEREADAWAKAILEGRKSGARGSTLPEPPSPGKLTQVPSTRIQRDLDETSPQKRPSYTREHASRDATALYKAAFPGLTGLGTEEDEIWNILEKRTRAELDLIREQFRKHYKLDLDKALRDEFSGTDLERLDALLAGDKGLAGAIVIHDNATIGLGHGETILQVLRQASPAERQAIAHAFHRKYGRDYPSAYRSNATPAEFLRKVINPYLDILKQHQSQVADLLATTRESKPSHVARLEANVAGSQVRNALRKFLGADPDEVLELLKPLPSEQRSLLLSDTVLMDELRKGLSPQDFASARALLEGRLAAYDAALLRKALESWSGPDKTTLQNLLKGKTAKELKAIQIEFYVQTKRSLVEAISALGGLEATVMLGYLNPPAASTKGEQGEADARRLRLAMAPLGTDEQALREVLGNKSKPQINQIAAAYQRLFGNNLREDLASELSGRDGLDILLQMFDLGAINDKAPGAAQERLNRLKAQQRFERSLGLDLINQVQTVMKGESDDARLTRQLRTAAVELEHGKVNAARQRLGYATDDLQTLRETKNSVAETTSSVAVGAVTMGAVIMTGGAATPVAIAGYSALGATTRVATQRFIQGESLGGEDIIHQGTLGLVEGGTVIIPLSKGGSLLSGRVGQAVRPALGQRVGATLLKGSYEGAVGGMASGTLEQTLQSETWSNGTLRGLGRVTLRAGTEGLLGAATGGVTELGLEGLSLLPPAFDFGSVSIHPESTPELDAGTQAQVKTAVKKELEALPRIDAQVLSRDDDSSGGKTENATERYLVSKKKKTPDPEDEQQPKKPELSGRTGRLSNETFDDIERKNALNASRPPSPELPGYGVNPAAKKPRPDDDADVLYLGFNTTTAQWLGLKREYRAVGEYQKVKVLMNPSLEKISAMIATGRFKTVIIGGHGMPGYAMLAEKDGSGMLLKSDALADMLAGNPSVKSVIASFCYGARGDDRAVTTSLANRGIESVGYDEAVYDTYAILTARELSRLMAEGHSLEEATRITAATYKHHRDFLKKYEEYLQKTAATGEAAGRKLVLYDEEFGLEPPDILVYEQARQLAAPKLNPLLILKKPDD